MTNILQAYHYCREYHTLIFYLFRSEGYITWTIPLMMHAGIIYRATKVEQKGWLNKRLDISAKSESRNRRVFKVQFRDLRPEYEEEIGRFCTAVMALGQMPEDFLPDSVAFGVIPKSA